ncbi:hypothetical protein L6V77_33005 [Myxococcota bacterium]|nr:hypothetical protein [Myxococcota bacterium]
MAGLDLIGCRPENLLGYLAALGALSLLDRLASVEGNAAPTLSWQPGSNVARLDWDDAASADDVLAALSRAVELSRSPEHPVSLLPALMHADNPAVQPEVFRTAAEALTAIEPSRPAPLALLTALSTDAVVDDDKGLVGDTAFRTMQGAGHQHFLKFMRDLIGLTTGADVKRSLTAPFTYADDRPSLRWDPIDDRRYALRAVDPSTDVIRTERGANRLAIEALVAFPCVPEGRTAATIGFGGPRGVRLRYPLWTDALTLDEVGVLLSQLPDEASRATLAARGVSLRFETVRYAVGKNRNFRPSIAVPP